MSEPGGAARLYGIRLRPFVVTACLVVAGCNAAHPTAPTRATTEALEIHVDYPVTYLVPSRSVNMLAYKVDSDGTYRDVTSEVNWVSTQPDVLSIRNGVGITATAMAPGHAAIMASYRGLTDSLDMDVRPWQDFEDNRLRLQLSVALHAGHAGTARAFLNGTDMDVTSVATWSSSNPQILHVDGGRLLALRPGTVRITVSYGGYSDDGIVSVHPSAHHGVGEGAPER
jgi:hypothetical protein